MRLSKISCSSLLTVTWAIAACSSSTPANNQNGSGRCTAQDDCHQVGVFSADQNTCTNPEAPNGTHCTSLNKCLAGSSCSAGACQGGTPVTCAAVDNCHTAGTCSDPNVGCTNPVVAGGCPGLISTLPLSGCSGADYTAPVTFGNDATVFNLTVDTGSEATAVASSFCDDCSGISPLYTPGSSAQNLNKRTDEEYGDNSGWNGDIYSDSVNLAGVGAVTVNFVAITDQSQNSASSTALFLPSQCSGVNVNNTTQGLLGLGGTILGPPGTSAYIDILQGAGKVYDAFAVQMCDTNGTFWFGGYDVNAITAAPVYTPMDVSQGFYEVTLSDLQFGGVKMGLDLTQYGPSIADTGTTAFVVPTAVFQTFSNRLDDDPEFVSNFGVGFEAGADCYMSQLGLNHAQLDAALPTMSLVFPTLNGEVVVVTLPASESYLTPALGSGGQTLYCPSLVDGGAPSTDMPNIILGNGLMHSQVTIFDRAQSQLGFAPQQGCTSLP